MEDNSGETTKWKRLRWVFLNCQRQHQYANNIIDFVQSFMNPVRFVGRADEYEAHRQRLNTVLAFSGIELGADGLCRACKAAATLDEAEARVRTIRSKFKGRNINPGPVH